MQIPAGYTCQVPGTMRLQMENSVESYVDLDGTLTLAGDWYLDTKEGFGFRSVNRIGEVRLNGISPQYLNGTHPTLFEQLTLDNPAGIQLGIDQYIGRELQFEAGKLLTHSHTLMVWNADPMAISGADSIRYIVGRLRWYLSGPGQYHWPIGDEDYLQRATLTLAGPQVPEFVEGLFVPLAPPPPPFLKAEGGDVEDLLNRGYWHFVSPPAGTFPFDLQLQGQGHDNGGTQVGQHVLLSRPDSDWESLGTHLPAQNTGIQSQPIQAARSGLTRWGDFALAKLTYPVSVREDSLFSSLKLLHNGPDGQDATLNFYALHAQLYRLEAYDLTGKVLFFQVGWAHVGENEIPLKLHRWGESVKILHLWDEKRTYSFKIW